MYYLGKYYVEASELSYEKETITKLKSLNSELLEALKLAHECIVVRAGVRTNASEKDIAQDRCEIDRTILKAEQAIKKARKHEQGGSMKKPEKKYCKSAPHCGYCDDCNIYKGRNQAIDEYEKWLPSEEEIKKEVRFVTIPMKQDLSKKLLLGSVDWDLFAERIAKAISKRIKGG